MPMTAYMYKKRNRSPPTLSKAGSEPKKVSMNLLISLKLRANFNTLTILKHLITAKVPELLRCEKISKSNSMIAANTTKKSNKFHPSKK